MGILEKLFGKGAKETVSESRQEAESPPARARDVPQEWGWYRLHARSAKLKALGYYYRDRMAGPSFNMLFDLATPASADEVCRQAAAARYRGSSTFRLPGHETLNVEGLPEDFASMLRAKYEQCDGPGAVLLRLTRAERAEYGLPDSPPWIGSYL
jgi:hypothetical protein